MFFPQIFFFSAVEQNSPICLVQGCCIESYAELNRASFATLTWNCFLREQWGQQLGNLFHLCVLLASSFLVALER